MFIFNEIETIKQFYQIELRQHMLEIINKITDGATYDPRVIPPLLIAAKSRN